MYAATRASPSTTCTSRSSGPTGNLHVTERLDRRLAPSDTNDAARARGLRESEVEARDVLRHRRDDQRRRVSNVGRVEIRRHLLSVDAARHDHVAEDFERAAAERVERALDDVVERDRLPRRERHLHGGEIASVRPHRCA